MNMQMNRGWTCDVIIVGDRRPFKELSLANKSLVNIFIYMFCSSITDAYTATHLKEDFVCQDYNGLKKKKTLLFWYKVEIYRRERERDIYDDDDVNQFVLIF